MNNRLKKLNQLLLNMNLVPHAILQQMSKMALVIIVQNARLHGAKCVILIESKISKKLNLADIIQCFASSFTFADLQRDLTAKENYDIIVHIGQ